MSCTSSFTGRATRRSRDARVPTPLDNCDEHDWLIDELRSQLKEAREKRQVDLFTLGDALEAINDVRQALKQPNLPRWLIRAAGPAVQRLDAFPYREQEVKYARDFERLAERELICDWLRGLLKETASAENAAQITMIIDAISEERHRPPDDQK
jgi:hypothetical protein